MYTSEVLVAAPSTSRSFSTHLSRVVTRIREKMQRYVYNIDEHACVKNEKYLVEGTPVFIFLSRNNEETVLRIAQSVVVNNK